jgi:DNA invertase Pin-like site-specific DNA recombinase
MENHDQLVQEIHLCVRLGGYTETARALQVSVYTLKKLLKSGEIPAEVIARAAEIGLMGKAA